MKETILGFFGGLVILGIVAAALVHTMNVNPSPAPNAQVAPMAPQTPSQDQLVPPKTPTNPTDRAYSASFIKGYHDGYSGAWLAPARWLVTSEYRAGWTAGSRDRENGRPNMFINR